MNKRAAAGTAGGGVCEWAGGGVTAATMSLKDLSSTIEFGSDHAINELSSACPWN